MLGNVAISFILFLPIASAFDMVLNKLGNNFVFFQVTLTVPSAPVRPIGDTATYFLWPGLQPGFAQNNLNFEPLGNGVMQPVLSFGPSCIPNVSPVLDYYSTWIISALYVNLNKQPTGNICNGGEVLIVSPGEQLLITMELVGTVWQQSIRSLQTSKTVSYSIDLKNQTQGRAELEVELYHAAVQYFPITFESISLRVMQPDSGFCLNKAGTKVNNIKASETCTEGILSADGVSCRIDRCSFAAIAPAPPGKPAEPPKTNPTTNTQNTSSTKDATVSGTNLPSISPGASPTSNPTSESTSDSPLNPTSNSNQNPGAPKKNLAIKTSPLSYALSALWAIVALSIIE
ncbi:UNVERIFIED_CONTAM: hypothetical protein HDU68_002713 [Siphonaria sp. JEL0065]|nr:hypothetical protein HDU68_002713 [Siphonaria sp. JEL0065]